MEIKYHYFVSLLYIVLVYGIFRLYKRWQRLSNIPGPFLATLTDFWRVRIQWKDQTADVLRHLHSKYGPLVRIGPNTISVGNPHDVPIIYTSRGDFPKADSYRPLRAYVNRRVQGSMIDSQDEDHNRIIKRAVGTHFTAHNVADFEPVVQSVSDHLLEKIHESQGKSINIYHLLHQFQTDFLMQAAFSEDAGHLDAGKDVIGLGPQVLYRVHHWYMWQGIPTIESLIFKNPIWSNWLFGTSKSNWAAMGLQRLEKRLGMPVESDRPVDLLEKYIRSGQKYPETLGTEGIANLVTSTISAGADTTAATMSLVCYFVHENPEVKTRVLEEIAQLKASGHLSDPPRASEVSHLSYLDACIKEALRLQSLVAGPLERVVPDGGAVLSGQYIPGGTIVGCSGHVVHHDRECYGADADRFNPDRWLISDEKKRTQRERAFLGFGSGKRICLGRHVAMMEIKMLIPLLFTRFDIRLVEPPARMPMKFGIVELEDYPMIAKFVPITN